MILTCPACSTRYTVDAAKFPPAGRTVRCAKCAHSWHQPGPEPEPVIAPEPEPVLAVPAAPEQAPAPLEDAPFASSATRAYAPAAQVVAEDKPRGQGLQMAAVALGWGALIVTVLLIGYSAYRYREHVANIWPQSAGVYSSLGLKVNPGGIDFHNVAEKRDSEDGQPVLVVTGDIVNLAGRELAIPQIVRVTLSDADNRELYHWTFKPSAATLKAGGSLPFRTRLSSPPAAARHLELRFAKDGS